MSTAEKLLYLQNGVFKRKEMSNGIQYYSNNSFGTFALPSANGNYVLTNNNNVFTWTASDNRYIDPETTTVSQSSYGDLATQFGELYSNPSCRLFGCNLNITF